VVQWCSGGAVVVQWWCRGLDQDEQRSSGAAEQRCRGAEVQRFSFFSCTCRVAEWVLSSVQLLRCRVAEWVLRFSSGDCVPGEEQRCRTGADAEVGHRW